MRRMRPTDRDIRTEENSGPPPCQYLPASGTSRAAFTIPDLRNKIFFTLFIIAVYRLGDNIIAPGVDFNAVQSLEAAARNGGVISYLNLFSGGALTKLAVFGLGIMPYITASIIVQLLMVVIPKFEQWRDEGPSGQRKLTQVTRYMTIALAIMQSTGLAYAFHNGGGGLLGTSVPLNVDLIPDFTVPRVLLIVITLTAGTVVVMWLAELITQRGVGQGMSVLIFTNVIAGLPTQGNALLQSAGAAKFTFLLAAGTDLPGGHRLCRACASGGYPSRSPKEWWAGECTAAKARTSR